MNDIHEDRQTVYEIGYLIASSVAEEHVPAETDKIKKMITDAGATIVSDEAAHRQKLAYEMRVKEVSGAYKKYDEAYFGWIKFEVGSSKIEGIKKAVELLPSMVRMLLITTVRENTYLGKRAPAIEPVFVAKRPAFEAPVEEKKDAAPATIEEMDKSIDEMVKEV